MRAASLLGVFLGAKLILLFAKDGPSPRDFSPWAPLAFIWQDLLVAFLFLAVDLPFLNRPLRRAWPAWILYAVLAGYTAINVPLTLVTSSPLTAPMLKATRGTLSGSIAHHLTPENLGLALLLVLTAAGLPLLFRRLTRRALLWGAAAAFPLAALGPFATSRVETGGLNRNAVLTLALSAFPRISPGAGGGAWEESPFPGLAAGPAPGEDGEDLSRFRGAARGRHVVLVVLESTGSPYLAPYGAAEDPMPNLTRVSRKGILFENAYAVYPESIKGLFSVLFSIYPAFDTPPADHARVASPTLAAVLAGQGYRTALFHSGRFGYLGMEALVRERGFGTLEDAGDIGGERRSSFGVDEASTVRRILDWIDGLPRGEPFFITYLPIAGHHPYETPVKGPFAEREEIGRYRNALHSADQALAALLGGLRERGLDREALVAIFGDHGEAFHQHPGNYGHTFFLYEENLRVPFLLLLPGALEEELRVRRVASLIDTAPTVLDLLGLEHPPEFQGRSLLEDHPRMALFFTDYSLGLLGLRDGPWKVIHELESGRSLLFDLQSDPGERQDLSGRFPDRVQAYRERLLAWSSAQRERVLRGRN